MAQRLPQNEDQLLAIHGVGALKLANYGQQFLEVISQHCSRSGTPPGTSPIQIKRLAGGCLEQVARLFSKGQTVDQIAAAFQIKPATVVQHLYRFAQAGGQLDAGQVLAQSKLPSPQQARVLEAFQQLGLERLGPIYEALRGSVPYAELHLLRLYRLCRDTVDLLEP